MSLRSRLLSATAVLLLALAAAMGLVARSQHRFLLDQLDRRLAAVSPVASGPRPPKLPDNPAEPIAVDDQNSVLSELYVGRFDPDDRLQPIVTGALVDGAPDLSVSRAEAHTAPFTVEGTAGSSQFRVLAIETTDGGLVVLAIPLDELEDAQSRLVLTLALAWFLVLVVLSLTTWWMVRLGFRPIHEMTETAEAIARGERDRRVAFHGASTETGRLGQAFNTMLDERDRAEQRLRTFIADASHELRTPLTSVRGYLDLAIDGDLPPNRLAELLRRARSESRRMGDLVDDLFLLAKLDEGRSLSFEPVDLRVIVADATSDATAVQPSRRIEVEDQSDDDAVVAGDHYRLRQVVAALVHNALVHTPTSAIVRLTTRSSGDAVTIDVSDEGPGLPAGFENNIFDRFSRAETSRTRNAGGSGLGLAIARSIVEAHHGTISVTAPAGSGCTFSIRLPREQATKRPAE